MQSKCWLEELLSEEMSLQEVLEDGEGLSPCAESDVQLVPPSRNCGQEQSAIVSCVGMATPDVFPWRNAVAAKGHEPVLLSWRRLGTADPDVALWAKISDSNLILAAMCSQRRSTSSRMTCGLLS